MQAVRTFWARSHTNKAVVLVLIGLVCCCPIGLAGRGRSGSTAVASPTAELVADVEASPVPVATDAPATAATATLSLFEIATQTAAATTPEAPSATSPATLTPSAEVDYEQVAREAARPLDTRAAVGLPDGQWNVSTLLPGEVQVTYPMTAGTSNPQTVRQGQRQIAAIVVALFEADPELTRVNVIGTLPLGENEAPAISVALTREEFASWSGIAEELPGMQVSQRLR